MSWRVVRNRKPRVKFEALMKTKGLLDPFAPRWITASGRLVKQYAVRESLSRSLNESMNDPMEVWLLSSTNPISKLLRMLSQPIGRQRIRSTAIRRVYEAWGYQLGNFLLPMRSERRLFQ